jgi:hypothetical protein
MTARHAHSIPKALIAAVRARRIALRMTIREFSKQIGRDMWIDSEWENGRAVPRAFGWDDSFTGSVTMRSLQRISQPCDGQWLLGIKLNWPRFAEEASG